MKTREFEKNQKFESLTKLTKIELLRECFHQSKNSIFKKKDRIELQKNFNFLHLCDLCIATCDKYRNKSNYEVHQTFFNVIKMNRIENVLQKILCVESFHTSNSTK